MIDKEERKKLMNKENLSKVSAIKKTSIMRPYNIDDLLLKLPELQITLLIGIHYPPLLFVSLLLIAAETHALLFIS